MKLKRKLLIQCDRPEAEAQFPKRFEKIAIDLDEGISKKEYVEKQIIKSINKYNCKLNISEIEYVNINNQFEDIITTSYTGVIVEDIEIQKNEEVKYKEKDCYIWNDEDKCYARKIIIHVFLSPPTEDGRNILFTQSIFPATIDYMIDFIHSPSYTITNHPMYFINIINKRITADTLIKRLESIIATGFEYIEVFDNNTINPSEVASDIKSFIRKHEKDYEENNAIFSTEYYEINFDLKEIKIKTDRLRVGEYLIEKNVKGVNMFDFNGSGEKFYWIEILPIVILGCNNNYKIDFSNLEEFYNSNIDRFSDNGGKIQRFDKLIKFIKKITFS